MFEEPAKFKLVYEVPSVESIYSFIVKTSSYNVYFKHIGNNVYTSNFLLYSHNGEILITMDKIDVGLDVSIVVFITFINIMKDFASRINPSAIEFRANDADSEKRASLYKTLTKKFIPDEYEFSTVYIITPKNKIHE